MPPVKYNARDVEFQIEDFNNPGTWVPIAPGAINTFSKSHDEETADTTAYGSNGQAESQKMQISKTMTLEGFRLRDPVTGVLDPGQSLVEQLNDRLGDESVNGFRFAHKDDTSWEVWQAHCNLGDQGGGNNDKVSWAVTFTRSGASSSAVKS